MPGTNTIRWLTYWKTYPILKLSFCRSANPVVHCWEGGLRHLLDIKKLDDLLWGIRFTIGTDHRNFLYLNKHGSRKVLQWKLDIQHYDAVIEHVPGEQNIPADVFSRLVPKPAEATPDIGSTVYWCQQTLIKENHEWQNHTAPDAAQYFRDIKG